jgi:hypothetical protein
MLFISLVESQCCDDASMTVGEDASRIAPHSPKRTEVSATVTLVALLADPQDHHDAGSDHTNMQMHGGSTQSCHLRDEIKNGNC